MEIQTTSLLNWQFTIALIISLGNGPHFKRKSIIKCAPALLLSELAVVCPPPPPIEFKWVSEKLHRWWGKNWNGPHTGKEWTHLMEVVEKEIYSEAPSSSLILTCPLCVRETAFFFLLLVQNVWCLPVAVRRRTWFSCSKTIDKWPSQWTGWLEHKYLPFTHL